MANELAHESVDDSVMIVAGRRLAELELYLLLAKMIPKYHFSTSLKSEDLKLQRIIVLRSSVPVPLNLKLR